MPAPCQSGGVSGCPCTGVSCSVVIVLSVSFPGNSFSAASVPSRDPSPTIAGNVPPYIIASAVISPMAITSRSGRGFQIAFLYDIALVKRMASALSRSSGSFVGSEPVAAELPGDPPAPVIASIRGVLGTSARGSPIVFSLIQSPRYGTKSRE